MVLLAEKMQNKNSAVKESSVINDTTEQNRKLFNGRESLIWESETWIDPWVPSLLYLWSAVLVLYWSELKCTPRTLSWWSTGLPTRWRDRASTMLNEKMFRDCYIGKRNTLISILIMFFHIHIFECVHAYVHA